MNPAFSQKTSSSSLPIPFQCGSHLKTVKQFGPSNSREARIRNFMAQNQAVGLGEFSKFISKALCPLYLLHLSTSGGGKRY